MKSIDEEISFVIIPAEHKKKNMYQYEICNFIECAVGKSTNIIVTALDYLPKKFKTPIGLIGETIDLESFFV